MIDVVIYRHAWEARVIAKFHSLWEKFRPATYNHYVYILTYVAYVRYTEFQKLYTRFHNVFITQIQFYVYTVDRKTYLYIYSLLLLPCMHCQFEVVMLLPNAEEFIASCTCRLSHSMNAEI